MAALDTASTLLDMSDALREVYAPEFPAQSFRFGRGVNKLFTPSKREISGDGWNIQVEDRLLYNATLGRDINGAFPTPRGFGADTYKATLSETSSSNDFSDTKASGRVTYLDLKRIQSRKSSAVDVAARIFKEIVDDVNEIQAVACMLDEAASIGTVSGAPRQNNSDVFTSCTVTPGASTGARFVVTSGSIAIFQRGRLIDVYTSAGVFQSTLFITDYNPADDSVGVYAADSNGNAVTATQLTTSYINDTDLLYLHDMKDAGMISMGEWFKDGTSGESFFGKDRTDADTRWMVPTSTGPATARTFARTDLDDAAIAMGFVHEDAESGRVAFMEPALHQTFRNQVGEDNLNSWPTTEQKGKLIAQYGFEGAIYRHPQLGRVMLQAEALMTPDTIWMPRLGDWERLNGLPGGFDFIPSGDGHGFWYREQAAPGTGKGTTYRIDGMSLECDITAFPRRQLKIDNVQP